MCLLVFTQQHFSFANGQIVSACAPGYYRPDCTGQTRGVTAAPLVYAPGGTNADALCWQAQPGSVAFVILSLTPDVFICYLP